MNKLLFVFFLSLILGCNQNKKQSNKIDIQNLFWMDGNWEYKSENGIYYEDWINSSSNFISGNGYFISKKNDTLYSQKMKLIEEDGEILLILNAQNFNEERDVKYKLINTFSGNEFYFENLFKDYPSIIKYTIENDTLCSVVMQGNYKGKTKAETFQLSRKTKNQ